jgi:tetratricopeptide (TPR) repeat protein
MDAQIQQLIGQAIQHFQNGALKQSEVLLAHILAVQPKNLAALEILGLLKASQGRYAESIGHLSKAVKLNPQNPATQYNYAKALSDYKDYEKSLIHYGRALQLDPNNLDTWFGKGKNYSDLGRLEDALICYDKILSLRSDDAEAWFLKGVALEKLAQYEGALQCFGRAIEINPTLAKARNNKANVLQEMKRYFEALSEYEMAITLDPKNAGLHSNKGSALERLGYYQSALEAFDSALEIESKNPDIYVNKARTLLNLRLYDQAFAQYRNALLISPDHAGAHQGIAVLLLRDFDFGAGWKEYEWRWLGKTSVIAKLKSSKPQWDGNKDKNKLLVWGEQGIGDQILFSSLFHELLSLEKELLVSVDRRLIPIFRRSFPAIKFLDKEELVPESLYDEQIAIGDLAKHFRINIDSFRGSLSPYLIDDQLKTNKFKATLKDFGKKCCGLAWQSTNKDFGDDKSIPILDLMPLLGMQQYKFINLQHGSVAADILKLENSCNNNLFQMPEVDLTNDLNSVLSLVQSCDLIITSSNSLAHIAGALNKKTILILPFESGRFWYWHEVNGYSLWYPSIRIFSQTRRGSWGEIIEDVKQYLEGGDFE